MNNDWETFFNSSVLKMKKAIISYNNFLEDDRLENFYIFAHIAFNRLFIAFCIKNDKKQKIKFFNELSNILKKESVITSDAKKIIDLFNNIRNEIHHNIHNNIDDKTINSIENVKFLTSLINLYKRIIFEIWPDFKLYENIIYFNNDNNNNFNIPLENTYMIKVKEIINKEELQNFFKEYAKNIIIANHDSKKENNIILKKDLDPNEITKEDLKPSEVVSELKTQFDSKFNKIDFTNILKYFCVFSLPNENSNWEPWNMSNNYEKLTISNKFKNHCYKLDITKSILYKKSIIKLLLNFLQKYPNNYKNFLKEQKNLIIKVI
ncbi:hypothetical protein [Spiroplasma endosymbiont of Tricholauxania praeusta]|uniref:hypothetical protein n=1 Tax=Spiroplasma endosymbiont of Tricholauxania praeusta TaxID=3066296 RepID=UPI0030D5DB54